MDDIILEQQQLQYQLSIVQKQTMERTARLQIKLPDIQMALDAVNALIAKKDSGEEIRTDFELADGVFACGSMQVRARALDVCLQLQPGQAAPTQAVSITMRSL